jgi:Rps23 Pro-64 3,4-dihydroxylase Tpa1-like proline 4-hydroxylase
MKAQVVDDCIEESVLAACIDEAENAASYRVLHGAGDGSYGFKYNWMVYDSEKENDQLSGVFLNLWNEIAPHVNQKARVHRCYVNAHTYGVEDAIHEDDKGLESGLTVIVYLCRTWYPEWFGQTVFWEHLDRMNSNDIVRSVIPKRNRFLIFDKRIPHCVSPLSRRFSGVRLTCMFKLETKNDSA